MAKPILPDDLTAAMPAGRAAAKFIDAKIKEVRRFVDPALTGDVDGVHDMRVAVKRLREAFRLFRRLLPKKAGRKLLALVEELNEGLGGVRDRDVLMENAAWFVEHAPDSAQVLDGLANRWEQERASAHEVFAGIWARLSGPERIFERLRRLAKLARGRKRELGEVPIDRFAYMAITTRLERVQQCLAQAVATGDPAALHRLRITVKRLKYTMEPFSPVFPAMADPYKTVADVQEVLGLIHDLDVLEAAMTGYCDETGLSDADCAAHAFDLLRERRNELYADSRESTALLGSDDWTRQLLDSVD